MSFTLTLNISDEKRLSKKIEYIAKGKSKLLSAENNQRDDINKCKLFRLTKSMFGQSSDTIYTLHSYLKGLS